MSAFIVSNAHIDYMVMAATSRMIYPAGDFSWYWAGQRRSIRDFEGAAEEYFTRPETQLGQMLIRENILSLRARYAERADEMYLLDTIESYEFQRRHLPLTPAQIIKACHCYAYQSCEHGQAWRDSEACAFTERLIDAATRKVQGYEDAAWEISDDAPIDRSIQLFGGRR